MASSGGDTRNEDRLPWLETVEEDHVDGPSILRIAAFVLLGLAFIAALVFGVYWVQQRSAQDGGGDGQLIAAQEGDYKVRPEKVGGMKLDDEASAAQATSQGASNGASIDLSAVPEQPIVGKKAPAPAPTEKGSATARAAVPASGGRLTAEHPMQAPAADTNAAHGSQVQLGAFPSEGDANRVWARMSKRFSYLAPLNKSVEKASVGSGTVYRLRVDAGGAGQANQLCGKLKVAGEACFVVAN